MFNSLVEVYSRVSIDGVIELVSPSVERITGYKPEELIGKRTIELYQYKEKREEIIRELLEKSFAIYQERLLYGKKGNWLWRSFKRHLRFLKQTGFVDKGDRLTPDGIWASKLRVDHPLLIAEAIRKGAMNGLSPEELAGAIAPFVWDRAQDVSICSEDLPEIKRFRKVFKKILKNIKQIKELKRKRGFDNPSLVFPVGMAIYLWTKGLEWKELLNIVPMDEGDMASLVMRTVDHLRQINNLKDSHPELASAAREAIELIMREPVYIY